MKKKNKEHIPTDGVQTATVVASSNEVTTTPGSEEVLEQEITLESGNPTTEAPKIDPLEELNQQIIKLQNENKDLVEKIKYSQAELVSYRMRKDEETASLLKYANQDLITEILPLVDNFERALNLAEKNNNPEFAKYLSGFQMMYTNLLSILTKFGVEEINRVGEVFDSKLEQAMVAENHPEIGDEVILEVLQKGYKLKDRVIRPASVKINQN